MLDVLIIGAGPAGAAAAIEAERGGLDARTIDKARFPRDKCCGDGLTAGALRHLDELGFDPASVPSLQNINDVRVAGPNRTLHTFPLPRDRGLFAAIARRRELDAALVDLARASGARIDEGVELESLEIDSGVPGAAASIRARANGETIRARHLIAADGMWSPSRKMLGQTLPQYRGDWHAFRQYFRNVSPEASTDLYVWFEEDLLPGYFWSVPLADGSANVGFGIQRGTGHRIQDMKTLWPDLLSRPHIREVLGPDAEAEGPHKAWPIPARLGDITLADGPVIWVGDAAAATDPMTGEGIGQALETGRLAVECILETPERAGDRYHTSLHGGMVKDHGLARTLDRVLANRRGSQWSLNVASSTAWTRRNFARWLFEDYPRAVLGTPSRWHRRLFSQSGAYVPLHSRDNSRDEIPR